MSDKDEAIHFTQSLVNAAEHINSNTVFEEGDVMIGQLVWVDDYDPNLKTEDGQPAVPVIKFLSDPKDRSFTGTIMSVKDNKPVAIALILQDTNTAAYTPIYDLDFGLMSFSEEDESKAYKVQKYGTVIMQIGHSGFAFVYALRLIKKESLKNKSEE